jgi:pantoate--beta-alanine ligase
VANNQNLLIRHNCTFLEYLLTLNIATNLGKFNVNIIIQLSFEHCLTINSGCLALMRVYKSKTELSNFIASQKQKGYCIGFVPTMGALHLGHLSLIEESAKQTDLTVVSIFVNPTQFNEASDFEKYPRLLEKDVQILENTDCDVIFAPETKEVYPKESFDLIDLDLGYLDNTLEGRFRPGHFQGVVTVVKKLFDIVQPDMAFLVKRIFSSL